MKRYDSFTRDGAHVVHVGDVMPGTERTLPIVAAADILQHDGYHPVVIVTTDLGNSGWEVRDGVKVWVIYELETE
ncbi:MAG: hypothetical protein J6W69_04345 [Bacteroidales bacterium]|nr:hypothetical protein [Bacteroidales bacterium]